MLGLACSVMSVQMRIRVGWQGEGWGLIYIHVYEYIQLQHV